MTRRRGGSGRAMAATLSVITVALAGCTGGPPSPPSPSVLTATPRPTPSHLYRLVDNLCEYVGLDAITSSLPYVAEDELPGPIPLPSSVSCMGDLQRSDDPDIWGLFNIELRLHDVGVAAEVFNDERSAATIDPLFADVDGIGEAAFQRLGYLGGSVKITILDGNAVIDAGFESNGALPAGTIQTVIETVVTTMARLQDLEPASPRSLTTSAPLPPSTVTYGLVDNLCDHVSLDAVAGVLPIVATELQESDSAATSSRVCIGRVGFREDFFYGGWVGLVAEVFASDAEAEARFEFQLEAGENQPVPDAIGQRAYRYIGRDLLAEVGAIKVLDGNAVFTCWWNDAQGRDPTSEIFGGLTETVRATIASLQSP